MRLSIYICYLIWDISHLTAQTAGCVIINRRHFIFVGA